VKGGCINLEANTPTNQKTTTAEQRRQQAAIVVACNMFLYINQLLTKHDASSEDRGWPGSSVQWIYGRGKGNPCVFVPLGFGMCHKSIKVIQIVQQFD